jgi:hypothetical protein
MQAQKRLNIVIHEWLLIELRKAATDKGISMSEYIKDTLRSSLPNGTLKKPIAENEPESKVI